MGLDGGTIVSRSDVLRGQSWRVAQGDTSRSTRGGNVRQVPKESAEKSVERSTAWSTCALSSQPLRPPIVACGLGRLYNKDAVLQFLLCRKGRVTEPEALLQYANQLRTAAGGLDHLTSLKDVFEVHLHPAGTTAGSAAGPTAAASTSAAGASTSRSGGVAAASAPAFVCPITLLPCERHPCSALRPCGHVVSDRALRNLGGDSSCPVCGAAFSSTLPILGSPEQVEALRDKLKANLGGGTGREEKKGRKRKAAAEAEAGTEVGAQAEEEVEGRGRIRSAEEEVAPNGGSAAGKPGCDG